MAPWSARAIVSIALCVLVGCSEAKPRRELESAHVTPADESSDAQVTMDASPRSNDAGGLSLPDASASDQPAPDVDPIGSENEGEASVSNQDPDEDAGALEPPDLSCGAFANATAGLAACGSLQPWQAPTLPYEGFVVERADWLPIDGDDGYAALVTLKRGSEIKADGWLSVYRFDEQGTCIEHVGTIENVLPLYGNYLSQAASRGGTLAVSIGYNTRVGTLGGLEVLANGKHVTTVQGDSRMDVTPAGEVVIAQTPYHEETGAYGLALRVFDAEGTLVREAEPASPGLVAELDASTSGELTVMYTAPLGPGASAEASRRIDRYGADLALLGSWLAPEGVVLAAFDVEGAQIAVSGRLSETVTTWTQVLELPDWNAAWSQGAQAAGLEQVVDVDLTTDGRVLLVGSTFGGDSFDWLLGYRLDGSVLWSEPQQQRPASGLRAVSGQQNGHLLIDGPRGYCDPP